MSIKSSFLAGLGFLGFYLSKGLGLKRLTEKVLVGGGGALAKQASSG